MSKFVLMFVDLEIYLLSQQKEVFALSPQIELTIGI
ncbi:hypothetical protein VIBC2010_10157 [Vibrio caribbeanicus ATCC BAA-2122]|uniref:Uncharacterized protein n=1 Tax=Vibrio caribbeanicus ATCC BAA-2122 TaxID=796620 RepID=E3BFG6_9VIBR|nr:hypothetical protein VIBC2010_10157 [Vibrio caribbeanicus ATCC BAA-2122]